jgi:hypothetical protein
MSATKLEREIFSLKVVNFYKSSVLHVIEKSSLSEKKVKYFKILNFNEFSSTPKYYIIKPAILLPFNYLNFKSLATEFDHFVLLNLNSTNSI